MKTYTEADCIKDCYNNDGTRSLFFECEDEKNKAYEIKIMGITLQLTEEIEKHGGGKVAIFAADLLNRNLEQIENEQNVREFLEDISE